MSLLRTITLEDLHQIIEKSPETVYFKNDMIYFGFDYRISKNSVYENNRIVLNIPANRYPEIHAKLFNKMVNQQKAARKQNLQKTR